MTPTGRYELRAFTMNGDSYMNVQGTNWVKVAR